VIPAVFAGTLIQSNQKMIGTIFEQVMTTTPSHDEDYALIRQVADGDEAGFQVLYARYSRRLYAYALRIVGNPAVAQDVLQESLIAIWQGAGRFRGEGRVIAWLLSIVHHKALHVLRRQPDLALEPMEAFLPDGSARLEDKAARREQHSLLRKGLDSMSVEHRGVLELVFYQGLGLQETADVCGCPVGTVKSRLNYAKQALRGELQRQGLSAEEIT
jgi:RNA polymerase sigma-70 factor (ECF subfamily)